jgi:hypothetical protein
MEKLYNLYFSQVIIRAIHRMRMKWEGHIVRMGEMINAYATNFSRKT